MKVFVCVCVVFGCSMLWQLVNWKHVSVLITHENTYEDEERDPPVQFSFTLKFRALFTNLFINTRNHEHNVMQWQSFEKRVRKFPKLYSSDDVIWYWQPLRHCSFIAAEIQKNKTCGGGLLKWAAKCKLPLATDITSATHLYSLCKKLEIQVIKFNQTWLFQMSFCLEL